jgi:hypothetical protein
MHTSNRCMILIYDRLAPMNDFALQTPSLVRILWTDFVSGSTHAASRLSSVMKPCLSAAYSGAIVSLLVG